MVVLIGMTAFVLDVGSWFRAAARHAVDCRRRRARRRAGASGRPATASAPARSTYANKNGGGVAGATSRSRARTRPNDTIRSRRRSPATASSRRSSALGRSPCDAHASADRRRPDRGRSSRRSPSTSCTRISPGRAARASTRHQTTLPLGKTGAPGAFELINLEPGPDERHRRSEHARDWIPNGYSKYLPLGGYFSDPGAKFNGIAVPERAQRADRHRPALPRLRHARRQWLERRVPRDRLGRLPPPARSADPRQQRHA